MFKLAIAAIVLFTSFSFANAQPPAGVQRERSFSRQRFSGQLPAQPLRRQFNGATPAPGPAPGPAPTPTPTPTPNPRPPRPAPNVIIRPRPIVINPGVRAPFRAPSTLRYRTVIRNGVAVQQPYYVDPAPVVQQPYVQRQSTSQYLTSDVLEQLKAENAALREENAYLKGQVEALKVK